MIPAVQGQVDGIKALKPPKELEKKVNQILSGAQKILDDAKSDYSVFVGTADPFADVNVLSNEIGLTTCGAGGEG